MQVTAVYGVGSGALLASCANHMHKRQMTNRCFRLAYRMTHCERSGQCLLKDSSYVSVPNGRQTLAVNVMNLHIGQTGRCPRTNMSAKLIQPAVVHGQRPGFCASRHPARIVCGQQTRRRKSLSAAIRISAGQERLVYQALSN